MSGSEGRPRRRRRRRPGPPGPPEGRQLGRRLHELVLAELRRRLPTEAATPDASAERLELRLEIDLRDPASGAAAAAESVDRALSRFVEDSVEAQAAFRPGFAFCHRCESSRCPHALPARSREVFGGYGPTGVPRWIELGQLLLEHRHPRLDAFYDEKRRAVVTQRIDGPTLRRDLLPEFHRSARHHDVAGQICVGLFRIDGLPDSEPGLALTFQAVVARSTGAPPQVSLNVIAGDATAQAAAADAPVAQRPWESAMGWARDALGDLSRRLRSRRAPDESWVDDRIQGILQGLARRLERDLRSRGRRTQHAEQRHQSGRRPTRMAIADLRAARDDAIFLDPDNATLVALGDRGRTHVFTRAGRLVTSLQLPADAIGKRVRQGRWLPAPADAIASLRAAVISSAPAAEPGDRT